MNSQEETRDWHHWGVVSSALIGALAGYLLTTPRGRRICDNAIHVLEDFSGECARFCQASAGAQIAIAEGWKTIEAAFDAPGRPVNR